MGACDELGFGRGAKKGGSVNPDIVLLPSFAQVEDWRKRHAAAGGGGLFACTVTTFNAWIADLWELHGDGRAIADTLQRQMVMQAAFEQLSRESGQQLGTAFSPEEEAKGLPDADDDGALTVSPGVVKLASQCVREAAGVPVFERAVACAAGGDAPQGLSAREAVLLAGVARCYRLLSSAGLVEVGQAAAYLAERARSVFPRRMRVLMTLAAPPDWRMHAFFDACDMLELQVEEAPGAQGVARLADGVELRFGYPSGRYAQPGLVADLVREAIGQRGETAGLSGDVVVTAKDPLALYKQIEQELARMGAVPCVQAQVPFTSTDFGRRFMALARTMNDETWSKEDLSDAVVPPFSGFGKAEALQVDKELRANRLAERDESLAALCAASDTFSQLEELASDPQADVLLGVFEQIAFSLPGRSEAWRIEQLAAASAVRSCTVVARAVGASMKACMRVLEDVVVTVSYEGVRLWSKGAEDAPERAGKVCAGDEGESRVPVRVIVTTQAVAAQMGNGACAQLILCDLTSEDYPVADRDDAAATLFVKLGLRPVDTMLARTRRMFASLQALPTARMTCLRPLSDWDGNPTYPAAMLQELVDAYLPEGAEQDDLDELYGVPEAFLSTMVQRGEELLFANAGAVAADVVQPQIGAVESGVLGDMPEACVPKVALSRRLSEEGFAAGFSPSPSQVETYLECPYKWFAERRINLEMLDEGFGALERGSFCHKVLQRFYRAFDEQGFKKVTPDNIGHAREIMRALADDEERVQREMEPGSGRYVAADQIEWRDLQASKRQLVEYLDFEAEFLPTFHPAYLEYEISPQAGVTYAGHPFMGIVDRIDVDDEGHAVIVDYKGSVGAAHEIAGKGPHDPGKVQTRMYARAVERALGLRVVGALYVSYGKKRGCAGAFDGGVLETAYLPGMRVDHCSCALEGPISSESLEDFSQLPFPAMLDATEDLVAQAMASMQAGRVQPQPASPDACTYCPVAHCPKRGA